MIYKDFVSAWQEGRENWRNYQFEVGSVAGSICSFFAEKLELDKKSAEKYLKLYPLSEKDDEEIRKNSYAPFACVEFKSYGWASVGLRFLLEINENSWPKNQFIFELYIKKIESGWLFKLAEKGKKHTLSMIPTDFEKEDIWNEFVEIFRNQTVNNLDKWLAQTDND